MHQRSQKPSLLIIFALCGGVIVGAGMPQKGDAAGVQSSPAESLTSSNAPLISEARVLDKGGIWPMVLPWPPRTYVEGRLVVRRGSVVAVLAAPDGTGLRHFPEQGPGETVIHFVVPPHQGLGAPVLDLRASAEGAEIELSFIRVVEPGEQGVPPRNYLSPAIGRLATQWAAHQGQAERSRALTAFWHRVENLGTPLIEPYADAEQVVMTFLARDARQNARILGAPSGDHEWMEQLADSDVWFKSFIVPKSTRLSYRIARDVPRFDGPSRAQRVALLATAQADPFNKTPWPATALDAYGQSSRVALADAPDQIGVSSDGNGIGNGTLKVERLHSQTLDEDRQVALYRPQGVRADDPRAVVVVILDGQQYRDQIPTPQILDALVQKPGMPPLLGLFIDNPDGARRNRDLPSGSAFTGFVADEALPLALQAWGQSPDAARVVVVGSSYGGLAAVRMAVERPEIFGAALSMSGSFWWHPAGSQPAEENYWATALAHRERLPLRFHLMAGLFESGHGDGVGILQATRQLRDVLIAKGYQVSACEYAAGHDPYAWQGALGDGLIALLDHRIVRNASACP